MCSFKNIAGVNSIGVVSDSAYDEAASSSIWTPGKLDAVSITIATAFGLSILFFAIKGVVFAFSC